MTNENLTPVLISGVSCYERDGTAYLRLEDVARGLGFTKKADSGNEVVNWTRVRQYLADLGVVQKCTTGDYIPENIFYRLAMKAKNETAEKFQALVADEIIPSKRFDEAIEYVNRWKPSTNTVMLIQQTNGQTSLFAAAAAQKNTTTAGKFVKEV